MSPEKMSIQGRLAEISTRQKVIAGLTLVVVLILLWQIKGLFSGGSSAPAVTTTVTKTSTTPNMSAQGPMASTGGMAPAPQTTMASTGTSPGVVQEANLPTDSDVLLADQKKRQAEYIGKLNELNLLRIDQQIVETNVAINKAKLEIYTAQKDISSILFPKPVSQEAYGSMLGGQLSPAGTLTGVPQKPETPPPGALPTVTTTTPVVAVPAPVPVVQVNPFTLISVAMQLQKWTAVIGYNGKLYNVSIGDTLPGGWIVDAITRNAVLLRKDSKTQRVTIVSEI